MQAVGYMQENNARCEEKTAAVLDFNAWGRVGQPVCCSLNHAVIEEDPPSRFLPV